MHCEWMETTGHWRGSFARMASPCEILIDSDDADLADALSALVSTEALRIERKYSRYRQDSEISRINRSGGRTVNVDAETARLLDYADQCYRLSAGNTSAGQRSSGKLLSSPCRRAWN
jgi:FAD:protein FMN transferase